MELISSCFKFVSSCFPICFQFHLDFQIFNKKHDVYVTSCVILLCFIFVVEKREMIRSTLLSWSIKSRFQNDYKLLFLSCFQLAACSYSPHPFLFSGIVHRVSTLSTRRIDLTAFADSSAYASHAPRRWIKHKSACA